MNNKDKSIDLGIAVAFAVVGFFFTGALSLAAGNTVMTSILRGAVGLFGSFILGIIVRVALHTFVGTIEEKHNDVLGKHIDLLLPEQSSKKQGASADAKNLDQADDFVPWNPGSDSLTDPFEDIDPEKLAEALRHLDD
jgi:hypothetical protein